ncbi:hypothetical protein [Nocardioides convexus]|uniref:hypothetical protein n=1 Tax=Nocardioides convexus TaxID=2712224 RepID=UPI00241858B3|nr:hypothetical protein [Nocardioides convexus]
MRHRCGCRLSGTAEHPRFEVHDASTIAPQPATQASGFDLDAFDLDAFDALDEEQTRRADHRRPRARHRGPRLRGLGRGDRRGGQGGLVRAGCRVCRRRAVRRTRLTYTSSLFAEDRTRVGEVAVQINGVPVRAFGHFQRHYRDLRREIRLLALAHEDDYPLAKVLSEHFDALERPLRSNMGREQVDEAHAEGRTSVDLRLRMPRESARHIGGLIDLLDAADEFSRAQRLLTAPRTADQRAFQIWFLGEFRRQSAGAPPVPWQGSAGSGAPSRAL